MKYARNPSFPGKIVGYSIILTAAFSFAVTALTLVVSNLDLPFETKGAVFLAIALVYPVICAGFYFWQRKKTARLGENFPGSLFGDEIEEKLLVLEEANEFFGASLKFSDMFRLVASRINEIVPFSACVLYLRGEGDNVLQIKYAVGENSRDFMNFTADTNRSLAAKAFLSGKAQTDAALACESRTFPPELLANFKSAAAYPLMNRFETFGVVVLYGDGFDDQTEMLLTAVGERVAPLFANSFAFEQSISNALTDSLTNLPNERGFFLVLENQLAESLRRRDERPLTVLAMDVANFAEINQNYGHAMGDRVLAFAAAIIKKQLRQMDVLTRSSGDEFLAVLPTANEKISDEVIERIKRAFVATPFQLLERESINLTINFGAATCWRDGETANQLLTTALLRKVQDKAIEKNKVIRFPKELVN